MHLLYFKKAEIGICFSSVVFFWSVPVRIQDDEEHAKETDRVLRSTLNTDGIDCLDIFGLFDLCISLIRGDVTVSAAAIGVIVGAMFATQVCLCYCCRGKCQNINRKSYDEIGFPIPDLPSDHDEFVIEGLLNMQSGQDQGKQSIKSNSIHDLN